MENAPPPNPTTNLSTHLYYQLVYTLTGLLPPPLDDTPEALNTRNQAAIAKAAALLPVNANELDLAAQCIAARAQAEDILRLLRMHTDDIQLIIRLNAQYSAMVRASLSVHGRLMRVQALRQKRDAIEGSANQDAWTLHITEQSMLKVADPHTERLKPAPVAAPASQANSRKMEYASENKTNSHITAFETSMSRNLQNQGPKGPAEPGLRKRLLETTAQSGLAGWKLPANGRESPARAA